MNTVRRASALLSVPLALMLGLDAAIVAQSRRKTAVAARSGSNDEEFARLVKQWTTRPEFSSPLVDHLPRTPGVPTTKEVLGYYVGTPRELTSAGDQQKYFKALERATPRVKTMVIGKTEEGRDIMVAFVSSDENIRNLETNRRNLKALADPRSLTDEQARDLIARTKPLYHVTAGLHSTEVSPPEMVMELAYRLAVSDEPYVRKIRDQVIVSFAPTLEVDGRDRVVEWYYAHKTDEPANGSGNLGGPPYWGRYVFHDNNRDINYGVDSLRRHLEWYLQWVPPIWHDLHQSQPFLYTFSGQPPNNENLDPILYSELPWFATYEVNKLTSYGMPGVWHFGFVDTWSPGYLGFAASNHNGLLRMYEIYGSDGANTVRMRIRRPTENRAAAGPTAREWFRPLPPYSDVEWSIRNSVNYGETALLSALELTSTFPQLVLENFYKKSRHAVERGSAGTPYAYVIPAGQRDMTAVTRVVNLLRLQGIEVTRARGEVQANDRRFPAGSFVVKLNQPYGPLAKTLLEKQRYPDPGLRTYDDSAWTMGLMSNVDVQEANDKSVLDAEGEVVADDVKWPGSVSAAPAGVQAVAYAVRHNGSLSLITLRHRLKDLPFKGARVAFKADDAEYPAGSFIIPVSGSQGERVRREIEALGLTGAALTSAPGVQTVDLDLPRVALYSTWSSTEKVGWVRLAFDRFEVPYGLIYKDQVRSGDLRARYDVIVIPHQGPTGKGLVFEQPRAAKPLPYRKSAQFPSLGTYGETDDVRGGMGLEGVAAFQKFVDEGGLLLTLGAASYFPAEFGLTRSVDAQRTQGTFYAPGPIVRTEIARPAHPVFYGLTQPDLPVRWADGPLLQVPETADDEVAAPQAPDRERAAVLLKFQGGEGGVLSGLMRDPDQIRNRPAIVEVTIGRGRMLLYTINPIYRWQNFGEHNLVFNALLYYNDLPAAGSPAPPTAPQF